MEINTLVTSCIFRTAYHICLGAEIDGIKVNKNGRLIVTFMLKGEGLNQLDKSYRSGKALVNPLELREALSHVKDQLFKRLNDENEGRYKNDRKRKDRRAKKKH